MTEREMIDRLCGQLNAAMYARAAVGGFDKAEALKVMADARALLSASIADTATHKLVPHEPTKEMLEAGREQWERIGYASDVWQAMYCAAPTPERADEYCAHEWEEMREPHKECVKCGEVRRDWKSKRGAGTCFRCGHISHSGPCVNVSPERADAELTPDRICQIAYMHSSDDDEPLFRFGHRELLEFVAAVKELSK